MNTPHSISTVLLTAAVLALSTIVQAAGPVKPPPPSQIPHACFGCMGVSGGNTLWDFAFPGVQTNPRTITYQGQPLTAIVSIAQPPNGTYLYALDANDTDPSNSYHLFLVDPKTGISFRGPRLMRDATTPLDFAGGAIAFNPVTQVLYGVVYVPSLYINYVFSVSTVMSSSAIVRVITAPFINSWGQFTAMAVSFDGTIYTLDTFNFTLMQMDSNGGSLKKYPGVGFPYNGGHASLSFLGGSTLYLVANGQIASLSLTNNVIGPGPWSYAATTTVLGNNALDRGIVGLEVW